ncbi:hypothetical protein ASPSYDRAFT_1047182 [Aspergillus sydowii CBS 593.65]|uniref:Uncharacterized protein n=1 Tax=Aspergillus sydowii CBS 593.65 TaxID=1036612 RepID=A0A1L9TFS2_9EURO|nr:uncharacterized protein ASPSYDRAFT_1047182 [Aspergillus sydowii CBS 593.65]OJJ58284.1 hypothetical protein ASPSYDRAFT_1047182 [Aspergillus sydowii CBS 593.65]
MGRSTSVTRTKKFGLPDANQKKGQPCQLRVDNTVDRREPEQGEHKGKLVLRIPLVAASADAGKRNFLLATWADNNERIMIKSKEPGMGPVSRTRTRLGNVPETSSGWARAVRDPRSRRRRCGFLLTGVLPHLPETSVAMELSGFPGKRPAAHVLSNVCTGLQLWDDSLRQPMGPL